MDLSKRKFLQQIGAVTAGASLIPIAEAGLNFSPTRREGNPEKRYGMLIDLRRCIGCQSCTVSCSVENKPLKGNLEPQLTNIKLRLRAKKGLPMYFYLAYVTTAIILLAYPYALFKQLSNGKTA